MMPGSCTSFAYYYSIISNRLDAGALGERPLDLRIRYGIAWPRLRCLPDLKRYQVLGLSDPEATWAKSLGYGIDLSKAGMGARTGRWYLILDDLKVVSTAAEPGGELLSQPFLPSFDSPGQPV